MDKPATYPSSQALRVKPRQAVVFAPSGRVIKNADRSVIPQSEPANGDTPNQKIRNIVRFGARVESDEDLKLLVTLLPVVILGFCLGLGGPFSLNLSTHSNEITSRTILSTMRQDLSVREEIDALLDSERESSANSRPIQILRYREILDSRVQASTGLKTRLVSFVTGADEPLEKSRRTIEQVEARPGGAPQAKGVVGRVHSIIKKYAPKHQDAHVLAEQIVKESRHQGYDPLFVAAVIKAESTFNPRARSHKGAQGLMQIMPATGKWLSARHELPRAQLTDPNHNLKLGISYLKQLEGEYRGNKVFTLVAYNWGPGHVQSATGGKRRIPKECMVYALKILNDYQRWQSGVL